ncbi:hypothetical protein EDC04DRAFT_2869680 [Pisolithus marmoratus]|nr:hypothetical protein EDC04DRAFT_2869680 [Pisolithus marmoratus]
MTDQLKRSLLSSEALVIVLLSPLFESPGKSLVAPISRTERWDDVQRLLTYVYVQATKVAQDNGRILMDVSVLLRGGERPLPADWAADGMDMCFLVQGDGRPPSPDNDNVPPLPLSISTLAQTGIPPPLYPVVALGGTFDHLHAGHKILLSMGAWIAERKLIVGVTDDVLLQKKIHRDLLEPFSVRVEKIRSFLQLFRPDLEYELAAITDVYGPTGWDPDIQALVVSKETLSVAKERSRKSLPALQTFVIDVISPDSEKLDHDDADMLRQTKMGSTFIREWIKSQRPGECK